MSKFKDYTFPKYFPRNLNTFILKAYAKVSKKGADTFNKTSLRAEDTNYTYY